MIDGEEKTGVSASVRKGAEVLNAARKRTELELAKRSVDLTTGGARATMVAAIAVAAAVPVADASHLFDLMPDNGNVGLIGAEGGDDQVQSRLQQAPCKRRCGIG